jgi:hypothetical protein
MGTADYDPLSADKRVEQRAAAWSDSTRRFSHLSRSRCSSTRRHQEHSDEKERDAREWIGAILLSSSLEGGRRSMVLTFGDDNCAKRLSPNSHGPAEVGVHPTNWGSPGYWTMIPASQ